METIRTSDFYEAAYYLVEGYPPESIVCRRLNKELLCDFYYSDPALEALQINFLLRQGPCEPAWLSPLLWRACEPGQQD